MKYLFFIATIFLFPLKTAFGDFYPDKNISPHQNQIAKNTSLSFQLQNIQNTIPYGLDFEIKRTIFSLKAETHEVYFSKNTENGISLHEVCYQPKTYNTNC